MGQTRWEVGGVWRCKEGDVGRVEERYVAGGREVDPMLMMEVMKVGRAMEAGTGRVGERREIVVRVLLGWLGRCAIMRRDRRAMGMVLEGVRMESVVSGC